MTLAAPKLGTALAQVESMSFQNRAALPVFALVWASACNADLATPNAPSEALPRAPTEAAQGSPAEPAAPRSGDASTPAVDGGGGEPPLLSPAVQFVGRFDTRDAAGPKCAWPGCRIVARFDGGLRLSVRLNDIVDSWMQGGPSEWDVTIDGGAPQRLVLESGSREYALAEQLAPGPHVVELYKRTEAQNGVTQFLGFDLGGGKLLGLPPRPSRRLEVVGDSAASGFGVEGVSFGGTCPAPQWAGKYQNFRRAWGARAGDLLGADVHGTVYSGKGLVRNIWRADRATMPLLYGRANPIDPSSTFDLASWVPDAVVVMLGGNDFALGQPVDDGPTPLPEFTQALRDLVGAFRARGPSAHVFLLVSPSMSDEQPEGRATRTNVTSAVTAVVGERNAVGDAKVYSFVPNVAEKRELVGCEGHGTPELHDRVGREVAAYVRSKTGW